MAIKQTGKPRRLWPRIVAWFLVVLIIAIVAGGVGGTLWLRSAMRASLPVIDGQQQLQGISAPVTVQRDAHGVPHIHAATLDDLLMAQGYVTAQDRLWQMDMARRSADGELAELVGSAALEHDKIQRLLQIRTTAEGIAGRLPERDKEMLNDFARGVNTYAGMHSGSLPAEFQLLHYRPRPWTAADSIAIALSMVQILDDRFDEKLGREQVTARLGPTLAEDLYPTGSWRDHPPTMTEPDLTAPQTDVPDAPLDETQSMRRADPTGNNLLDLVHLQSLLEKNICGGCQPGSNQWVVAGAHTASGKPLLANDMHLGHAIPGVWYEVDLQAPDFHAAGVTVPGIPFVIAGHNDHIAWGFTALYGDTQDVYIEPADGLEARHVAEVIRVRGRSDVHLDVAITAHGPVITPMLPNERRTLALKWSIYDPAISGLPLYGLDSAKNWTDFRAAVKQWWAPTQNMVYADDQGHIGYQAIGWIPQRANGLTGVPAQNHEHEWLSYVPFEALPSSLDPPGGILATANSRITPDGYPYQLTLAWATPYRNERIWKWLAGKNGLKREDMLALQTDIFSEADLELAQRFAYAIDQMSRDSSNKNDPQLRQAADLLRSWDGMMSVDSSAAAIVTAARGAWWPLVLEPKLGSGWPAYEWPESAFAQEEIVMHGNTQWLPPGYKNWDDLLATAVRKGLDADHAPADLTKWQYGYAHPIEIEHPLYGMLPWLKKWTGSGVLPQSGGNSTVKQVGRSFGPSQRFTMDWSDVDGSTENIVFGESGNPLSPYFSNQFPFWYAGRSFAMPFTSAAVTDATVHTLRLVP